MVFLFSLPLLLLQDLLTGASPLSNNLLSPDVLSPFFIISHYYLIIINTVALYSSLYSSLSLWKMRLSGYSPLSYKGIWLICAPAPPYWDHQIGPFLLSSCFVNYNLLYLPFPYWHMESILVSWGSHSKIPQTGNLNQNLFSRSSGTRRPNRDTGRFGFFWDLSPWFPNGLLSPHVLTSFSLYVSVSTFSLLTRTLVSLD